MPAPGSYGNLGSLAQQPIVFQYMFFCGLHYAFLAGRKKALTDRGTLDSDTVYIIDACVPHVNPFPGIVAVLATKSSRSDEDLLTAELGIYSAASKLIYKAVSDTHGHMGL